MEIEHHDHDAQGTAVIRKGWSREERLVAPPFGRVRRAALRLANDRARKAQMPLAATLPEIGIGREIATQIGLFGCRDHAAVGIRNADRQKTLTVFLSVQQNLA